jgi:hypothetical protein
LRGLVLKDVPVFDENSIDDAENVRRDPTLRPAVPREASMEITKSPTATITPYSYFSVAGMLLIRLKRPSRPGSM